MAVVVPVSLCSPLIKACVWQLTCAVHAWFSLPCLQARPGLAYNGFGAENVVVTANFEKGLCGFISCCMRVVLVALPLI